MMGACDNKAFGWICQQKHASGVGRGTFYSTIKKTGTPIHSGVIVRCRDKHRQIHAGAEEHEGRQRDPCSVGQSKGNPREPSVP